MRAGEEASDKGPGKRGNTKEGVGICLCRLLTIMLVGWRRRAGGKARLFCGRHPLMYGAVWYSVVRLWNGR